MIGNWYLTWVKISCICMAKPPSPLNVKTWRSGKLNWAAIPPGTPFPIVANQPEVVKRCSPVMSKCRILLIVTFPTSLTKIAFGSAMRLISLKIGSGRRGSLLIGVKVMAPSMPANNVFLICCQPLVCWSFGS